MKWKFSVSDQLAMLNVHFSTWNGAGVLLREQLLDTALSDQLAELQRENVREPRSRIAELLIAFTVCRECISHPALANGQDQIIDLEPLAVPYNEYSRYILIFNVLNAAALGLEPYHNTLNVALVCGDPHVCYLVNQEKLEMRLVVTSDLLPKPHFCDHLYSIVDIYRPMSLSESLAGRVWRILAKPSLRKCALQLPENVAFNYLRRTEVSAYTKKKHLLDLCIRVSQQFDDAFMKFAREHGAVGIGCQRARVRDRLNRLDKNCDNTVEQIHACWAELLEILNQRFDGVTALAWLKFKLCEVVFDLTDVQSAFKSVERLLDLQTGYEAEFIKVHLEHYEDLTDQERRIRAFVSNFENTLKNPEQYLEITECDGVKIYADLTGAQLFRIRAGAPSQIEFNHGFWQAKQYYIWPEADEGKICDALTRVVMRELLDATVPVKDEVSDSKGVAVKLNSQSHTAWLDVDFGVVVDDFKQAVTSKVMELSVGMVSRSSVRLFSSSPLMSPATITALEPYFAKLFALCETHKQSPLWSNKLKVGLAVRHLYEKLLQEMQRYSPRRTQKTQDAYNALKVLLENFLGDLFKGMYTFKLRPNVIELPLNPPDARAIALGRA